MPHTFSCLISWPKNHYWKIQYLLVENKPSVKTSKVHIFWEGHKNMSKSPNSFSCYLLISNNIWRFHQRSIFQTFCKTHSCTYFFCFLRRFKFWLFVYFFLISLTMQSFNNIGQTWYQTFCKSLPFDFVIYLPKIQRGNI